MTDLPYTESILLDLNDMFCHMEIKKNEAGETVLHMPTSALHAVSTGETNPASTALYVQTVYGAFLNHIGVTSDALARSAVYEDRNGVTRIEINLGLRPRGEDLSHLRDILHIGLRSTLDDQSALGIINYEANAFYMSLSPEPSRRFERLGIPDPGSAPPCSLS